MCSNHNPEILVVGTGAVGGFYGGKLAQAGATVSTVCRSDFTTVAACGIRVKSCWENFQFFPRKVIRTPKEYGGIPDYVLVALKVLPSVNVPEMLRDVVGPKTSIFLLQNGIDIEPPIAKSFPGNEIVSGLAFVCVSRTAPGCIHHLDYGRVTIGCFPTGTSKKAQQLQELFLASGVPCEISDDIVTERWKKLVWNAPFNSVSVLGRGLDTRAMVKSRISLELVTGVMKEVCKVAEAAGHKLPDQIVDHYIAQTRTMKPYKTSMLLDYEAGSPMEIEAILGNSVRIAQRNGVETPFLSCLYSLLTLINDKIGFG